MTCPGCNAPNQYRLMETWTLFHLYMCTRCNGIFIRARTRIRADS